MPEAPAVPVEEEPSHIVQAREAAAAAQPRLHLLPPFRLAAARIAQFKAAVEQEPAPTAEEMTAYFEAAQQQRAGEHLSCACRYAVGAGIPDDKFIAAARKLLAETRRKAEIEDAHSCR